MNMKKKYKKILVKYDISYTYNEIICGVFRVIIKKYILIVIYILYCIVYLYYKCYL